MVMESDEEVRRKPNPITHTSVRPRRTERESEETSDYYDILVIGKTGMGKSSTVDKLLVPEKVVMGSEGVGQANADKHLISPASPITADKHPIRKEKGVATHNQRGDYSLSLTESSVDEHRSNLQYEDLTAWVLCADDIREEQQIKAERRLKNIVYARDLRKSHEEVHRLRTQDQELYTSTSICELLANDTSKIRVLDIPGFHGAQHFEGATNTIDSNLGIVRKIVRIQALAGMRFRRVLYFLPDQGPLKRSDRIVQGEISQMVRYFGKSIFRCMVLVATISEDFSLSDEITREKKFKAERLESTRANFQQALVREFNERNQDVSDLPQPPVLFIAMTDTCEEILEAVTSAPVVDNTGLRLEFSPNVCIRCSINIGAKQDGERHDDKPLVCAFDKTWSQAIPYDESTCHPLMLPKYTAKSIARGILHLFFLEWCFSEERCAREECSQNPGTPGCMKIGTKYTCKKTSEEITVNHSCELDKMKRKANVKTKKQPLAFTSIQ